MLLGHVTDVTLNLSNLEFTEHQRNVFCVFSGEGVNRLRDYLDKDEQERWDSGRKGRLDSGPSTYRHREEEDLDDQTVAGLMHATGLGPDDEDIDDEAFPGEGSQYGGGEGETDG